MPQPPVLRFQVPYTADPPQLRSEAVGIARVRRGAAVVSLDTTLLDTVDNRLLRAGVVVAHRVSQGRGEWFLSAPGWSHLPEAETADIGDHAELPARFAHLIRPFTRGALIGPVASVHSDVQSFTLLDADEESVADIADEQVTVRRGGVTTARYREITIATTRRASVQQRHFVIDAMLAISASPVSDFPTLQQRLGPPATGPSDFPAPHPLHRHATMEELVTHVLARDLRRILDAELAALSGDASDLREALSQSHDHIRGFAHALDPEWCTATMEALDDARGSDPSDAAEATNRVVDAFVTAIRAPRLGDVSHREAAPLLLGRAEQAMAILADRCRVLDPANSEESWTAAHQAADQLAASAAVAGRLLGRRGAKALEVLTEVRDELSRCIGTDPVVDPSGMSPAEAFEAGRAVERTRQERLAGRAAFVGRWPRHLARITKQLKRAREKR